MNSSPSEQSPLTGASFLQFSDLLTGYRIGLVFMLVEKIGLIDKLGQQGATSLLLCAQLGWDAAYGQRFLDCLVHLGLLEKREDRYLPAPFSQRFLSPESPDYQGNTLRFERQLLQSWQQLEATLATGQRVYGTQDKSPEELTLALGQYLGSMDEAANQRAGEVFAALGPLADQGTILDLGGGSGAYLAHFLSKNPNWKGIFCDLDQVVTQALQQRLAPFADRITPCRCNLLARQGSELTAIETQSCDLVLLSNLIHCQGPEETEGIIKLATEKTTDSGCILIHDFFSDCGWRDGLYDLHMMLNTYNGRTYQVQECIDMAANYGFCAHTVNRLASGSTLICCARSESGLARFMP